MLEAFMKAGVPQHEDVHVVSIARQHRESVARVIERAVVAHNLAGHAEDRLELAWPAVASYDE
jgi:hypothetical protein